MEYTSFASVLFVGSILVAAMVYLVGQDDWWKF
jgi:hypothetical protein